MPELLLFIFSARVILTIAVAVGVFVTMKVILSSFFQKDALAERMKLVTEERNAIRERERAKLAGGEAPTSLRQKAASESMQELLSRFRIFEILDMEETKNTLYRAGYRDQSSFVTFLFLRLVVPAVMVILTGIFIFLIDDFGFSFMGQIMSVLVMAIVGFFVPTIYLRNKVTKRQTAIRRSFPDAMDLLLICVEAGMSAEAALGRVSREIGVQSMELAEEMALMTAELSYLQDRKKAYENLAQRTGLDTVKTFATTLIQADKYGTPLSQALETLAQENREAQMQNAERKAASLGPKLTVPMIVFFLPVLFVVILGPAVIQALQIVGQQ